MEGLTSLSHIFVSVFLSFFATFIVVPAITDVTMSALCPDQDECSLAIYLTGFQQAVIGLGTVVMMPVIGNLSDQYGRKTLLTFPMTISIIPLAIFAYRRTTDYFYAYYVLKTLTAMVSEGSVSCLALAYVADNISESQRTSAFGILSGITSAAFVSSTFAARFISNSSVFQVATGASMLALVYMRIFLKESLPNVKEDLTEPILKSEQENADIGNRKKITVFKKVPAVEDIICLLKSSTTFSQTAVVAFFSSLSDGGIQACLLYYLKAQFHFGKDEYANVMLLLSVVGMASQLILMPLLVPIVAEEKLLSIGLFSALASIFINGIAWSSWVPYIATGFASFAVFALPCLRSIASKQVGPLEQGKVQGCISGVTSLANIISPLIFSPLTALFLSERAPFDFPGFSILCIGLGTMIAFIQSVLIRHKPPILSHRIGTNTDTVA